MRITTIVSLGLFVILVALVFILPLSYRQKLQNLLYQTIAPFLETGNSISHNLGGVRGSLKRLDELERANEQLERENEQLRTANALLRNLQGEVSRLDRALGFEARSPFELIPARVIARDSASWWSTCTINRGKKDGIAPDMAVVTEGGLVGKIATAASSISTILLISDESLRVSVSVEGTSEQGILSSTRASSSYAPDLQIRFLSRTAVLKPGMKVVTTGTGGVFPSGVTVGVVKDFTVKELEAVAMVVPAVDLAKIQDLFVVVGQP